MGEFFKENQSSAPVKVGEWVVTILVTAIPIVGLIMLFVWAFGSGTNINKANWAKATLIWAAIGIVLWLLFAAAVGAFVSSVAGGLGSY